MFLLEKKNKNNFSPRVSKKILFLQIVMYWIKK